MERRDIFFQKMFVEKTFTLFTAIKIIAL